MKKYTVTCDICGKEAAMKLGDFYEIPESFYELKNDDIGYTGVEICRECVGAIIEKRGSNTAISSFFKAPDFAEHCSNDGTITDYKASEVANNLLMKKLKVRILE